MSEFNNRELLNTFINTVGERKPLSTSLTHNKQCWRVVYGPFSTEAKAYDKLQECIDAAAALDIPVLDAYVEWDAYYTAYLVRIIIPKEEQFFDQIAKDRDVKQINKERRLAKSDAITQKMDQYIVDKLHGTIQERESDHTTYEADYNGEPVLIKLAYVNGAYAFTEVRLVNKRSNEFWKDVGSSYRVDPARAIAQAYDNAIDN